MLERAFGGVSSEVLWKPVEQNWGLGAELNWVAQRDSYSWFGFGEYDYDVVMGHASLYWDTGWYGLEVAARRRPLSRRRLGRDRCRCSASSRTAGRSAPT